MKITIPMRAIGFNNYQRSTRTGRRYTAKRGKEFQNLFLRHLEESRNYLLPYFELEYPYMIDMDIEYYYSNYFVKKEPRLNSQCPDVDAPNKIIIDLFFEFIGIDDRQLKSVSSSKFNCSEDLIIIDVEIIKDPCFVAAKERL